MFTELRPKPFIPVTKPVMSKLPNYSHLQSNTKEDIPPPIDLSKPSASNEEQNNTSSINTCDIVNYNLTQTSCSTSTVVPGNTVLDNHDDTDSESDIDYSEDDNFSGNVNGQSSDSDSGEYLFSSSDEIPETPCADENNMALTQGTWETSSPKALPAIPVMGINKAGIDICVVSSDSTFNQTQSPSPLLHPTHTLCVTGINNDIANGVNNMGEGGKECVTGINNISSMPINNESGINIIGIGIQTLKQLCLDILLRNKLDYSLQGGMNNTTFMMLMPVTNHQCCVPRLTTLCSYAVRSTKCPHSLKTLFKLSITYNKLSPECVATQNHGRNNDHSYDYCVSLGQKSIAINREGYENFTPVDSLEQMLIDTTQQTNSSDTDIVIDSMNADIPLDTEDIYADTNRTNPDIVHAMALPTLPIIDSNTEGSSDSTCSMHHDNQQDMIMPDMPISNIYLTNPVET